MLNQLRNFTPTNPTVSIAATTSSARVALTASPSRSKDVVVYNPGTTIAFIRFGDATVAATNTSMPIQPATTQSFYAGDNTHVAAIMESGTATVYFTTGTGN